MQENILIIKEDYTKALSNYIQRASDVNRKTLAEMSMICMYLTTKHDVHDEHSQLAPRKFAEFVELINEELEGAELYASFHKQTGEVTYETMKMQELTHANFFIEKASKTPDVDTAQLEALKQRYRSI